MNYAQDPNKTGGSTRNKTFIANSTFEFWNMELIVETPPTTPIAYDKDYFEEFKKRSSSEIAERLKAFRKGFAEKHCESPSDNILDYGCGYAPIVRDDILAERAGQAKARWWAYDINEACRKGIDERWARTYQKYPMWCFFDCMEHFFRPDLLLDWIPKRFVATVPCVPDISWLHPVLLPAWKHFKPGEHYVYGTAFGWAHLFRTSGFKVIEVTTTESILGREHSVTFACVKDSS